jgi:hypothetical protein
VISRRRSWRLAGGAPLEVEPEHLAGGDARRRGKCDQLDRRSEAVRGRAGVSRQRVIDRGARGAGRDRDRLPCQAAALVLGEERPARLVRRYGGGEVVRRDDRG